MNIFELLCKTNTAPGAEAGTVKVIKEYFSGKEAKTDALGNLCLKITDAGEDAEKLAVFVSIDAPGLIVTYINDNGSVKVAPLGNCNYKSVCFSKVTNGRITGILTPDNADADSVDKSYVNFGFKDRKEAESELTQGDVLFFESAVTELKNGKFCGAGLGIKATASAVCLASEKLTDIADKSVYLVFCTQSELVGRGAYPAAFGINPHKALCIAPYSGKVFAVKVLDKSIVCDRELTEKLYEITEKHCEKAEKYLSSTEMSDASKVQSAHVGVRVASVMFPVENKNSLAETVCSENIPILADIIAEFLHNI